MMAGPVTMVVVGGWRWHRFYVGSVLGGQVLWKPCGGSEAHDTDLQFVDSLVRHLAGMVRLQNVQASSMELCGVMLRGGVDAVQFGIFLGDEPGMTKIYFSAMPAFSWTKAHPQGSAVVGS